ncbi:MAG TPA: MlaD family protein [Actinomycetota bacterium]|nr:MlaD family protein [Actinomycetota bacterium]
MKFPFATLIKVSIFAAACLAATVALAFRLGGFAPFSERYTLNAVFDDAAGVHVGDVVKVAGVDVGRVTGYRIERGRAVVSFEVDKDVHVTTTSRAELRWRNIMGQRYLYLLPSGGGRRLRDGDTIPEDRTDEAGDIGEFLNRVGPVLQAIDPHKANQFVRAVNTALSGNEAAVSELISAGASLATDLGSIDREIESTIDSSDTVLRAFASQDRALTMLLEDLNSVGGTLQSSTKDINEVLTDFADVQQKLGYLLRHSEGNIDSSLNSLSAVARTLADNRRNLERTICTLPIGVAGYYQTSSWGEWFNVRISQFLLRDSEGNLLASQSELPSQRPAKAGPAFADCPGAPGATFAPRGRYGLPHSPALPLNGTPGETGYSGIIPLLLEGGKDA